ncbi:MGH1-like glycoside hydrolase domain-containing protein [Jiangella mangrovi]|uniref:Glycogen debranching enzyme n=1 Tax=Jiangella mangrovi TaxID=1524084 RepID=A0A7W9GLY1_9ACTN|nr:trehalase family glycosidase [Jiangella mangrovi]MBB5785961.1 glycogen debranching enzyme [Jiangella mangrovi]
MTTPAPSGWNTWDVRTHTGMTHLPSGLRVRFGLLDAAGTPVFDGFTWRHGLVRLGHHTVDGSFAEVTVEVDGVELRLAMAGGPGDELYVRAESAGIVVVDWPETPGWRLDRDGDDVLIAPLASAAKAGDAGAVVEEHRAAADAVRPRSAGWYGTAADALTRAVTWNTIHAPDLDRVLTPTSRDFVSVERQGFYGTWALHAWDTFFTGLVASVVDRDYARGILAQILPFADDAGMIPNRVSDERGTTWDRSQPPVGALTVLNAYLAGGLSDETRDRRLLEETFDGLLAWHDWWPAHRRGPYGLLAWGSDPIDGDPESATLDRTKRESGLDDSPMYDEATYDPATHTMDLADAGLNALHVADAEALATMAAILGDDATAARLTAEADDARATAAKAFWDDDAHAYRNLRADGSHDPHVSPTLLYPLLGGFPDEATARDIADALLQPGVLGGDRPLPSVARNDPGFAATYWRGRIWAPMAYLAVQGLRRYDLRDHSRAVSGALLGLFLAEWDTHSAVRENYPAFDGEDLTGFQQRSDGLMAWGGLLAHLAFGELAEARTDGWRFAHPGRPAELSNLPLGDGRLTVTAGDRLVVTLDGAVLLDAAPGVVVTAYRRTADEVGATVTGTGDVRVAVPGTTNGEPEVVTVDGGTRRVQFVREGSPA